MTIRRVALHRWKAVEPADDLSELLEDVRKFGPQELEAAGIVYEVTVRDPKRPRSAKSYLAAGGAGSFSHEDD